MWIKYGTSGIGTHAVWVEARAVPPPLPPPPPSVQEDCNTFNPNNLAISGSGSNFTVVDGNHAVIAFGSRPDAQNAINRIRQHGYKRICFVGRPFSPGKGMMYFLP
jgi:hypothetical protein